MKKGDILPPVEPVALQTGGEPQWFVFVTLPNGEGKAREWFDRRGLECWYPEEERWRRVARGPRAKVAQLCRIVPGYVFVRFLGDPVWPEVRGCPQLRRVVGLAGQPAPVSDAAMCRMRQVPQRLEAMRLAAAEARRVRPGDRALIRDGAMAGWVVEVQAVHAGIARLVMPLLGERVTHISVARLERQQAVAR